MSRNNFLLLEILSLFDEKSFKKSIFLSSQQLGKEKSPNKNKNWNVRMNLDLTDKQDFSERVSNKETTD